MDVSFWIGALCALARYPKWLRLTIRHSCCVLASAVLVAHVSWIRNVLIHICWTKRRNSLSFPVGVLPRRYLHRVRYNDADLRSSNPRTNFDPDRFTDGIDWAGYAWPHFRTDHWRPACRFDLRYWVWLSSWDQASFAALRNLIGYPLHQEGQPLGKCLRGIVQREAA